MKQKNWEEIKFLKTGIAKKHKIVVLSAIQRLANRAHKPFGLLIILGWRKKWQRKYSLITDLQQNIFQHKPKRLFNQPFKRAIKIIRKTKYFDGAILVRQNGLISASGIYLTGLQPGLLIEHLGQKMDRDFSQVLGFKEPVHSRHLVAITASWQLKGTTVYTVSEESKIIRVYENGRIIYSTIPEEIWRPENV